MAEVIVRTAKGVFEQEVVVGSRHHLVADEPISVGGDDHGPAPHDFLLVGLGSCTSMTLSMYAGRKGWPLERVEVRLRGEKQPDGYVIQCELTLTGPLDEEQRKSLLAIAAKCPVHRTLVGEIRIETRER